MKFIIALLAAIALMNGCRSGGAQECEVPPSLVSSDSDLARVASEIKDQHRLDIAVVGTGSSTLPGPDGARFAYPARLRRRSSSGCRATTSKSPRMFSRGRPPRTWPPALKKILADDKPALVIWQAGTFDAVSGIEPDEFRTSLDAGVDTINAAGADVDLMNMQYSPRTESMLERLGLCGRHALGGAAARRAAVRPAGDHALLE